MNFAVNSATSKERPDTYGKAETKEDLPSNGPRINPIDHIFQFHKVYLNFLNFRNLGEAVTGQ